MSELEPNDSRVVHGNAKPEKGDERFAQQPKQAEQDGAQRPKLDDEAIRNPEQSPSESPSTGPGTGEDGSQQEQSVDNDRQFEASDLNRGEAQYDAEPLVQQQHQANDWAKDSAKDSGKDSDRGESSSAEFETGQADYGGAQTRQELVDDAEDGDRSTDDIADAAPQQTTRDNDPQGVND